LKGSPQPKVSALLRIFAGTCALLWLVGFAVCGMDRSCSAGHDGASAAQASPVHEHDALSPHEREHSHAAEHHHAAEARHQRTASHHDDGEPPQGHCGKNGCDDERCCSTIQALTARMTPIIIAKPGPQPVLHNFLLCATREHVFAVAPNETLRRAKPRDWVFTPVVCLGPAFRSLAPPSLA
jgi:hypothetical protein